MKTLILMRHAKSDWAAGQRDHERPLNARGQRGAQAIGAWLKKSGYVPDAALVSTAQRTRQTYDLLGFDAPVQFEGALYEASASGMLHCVRNTAAEVSTLLVVAHNPGTALLAHGLVASQPQHNRWMDIPTAATLVTRFEAETWEEIAPGAGAVLAFATPHDLPQS